MPQVKVGWRSGAVSPVVSVSKLLDTYSSSAAAYSLRKLSSTYTGSAIRVRRSSDNTEQNIGFDSDGNLDTVALSVFVGSGSGFVTTWYDQSGNSRDAFQTTASNQPLIVSSGLITTNGDKPAIRCASGTGLLINQINLGTTHSMFAVIDWISGNKEYFGSFGNSWAFYQVDGEYKANGAVGRTNASFTTNRFLGTLLRINTQLQYYQNSTTLGSPFTISSNNSFNLSNLIGEDYNWGFAGDQQEAIIYTSNMSSSRTGIESNINSYYSIYPNPTSVWNLLAAAYNADTKSLPSLKTSLYAAYNGESNANDSFGSNNGTANGGLTYGTGKIGNAFQFNGSNAYVSYANDTFKFTGDFSINLWVNIASSTTNSVFISNYFFQGGLGEAGWLLEHRNNGSLRFYLLVSSSINAQLNYSYAGKYSGWHMLTITKLSGSGACKMYVDGALVVTNSSIGPIYYNSFNYSTIGVCKYVGGMSGYLENGGKIDAVNLWQKALTQAEITELYNSGNGAQYIGDNFYKPTTNDALNTYNGTAQGGLTYGVGKVGTAFIGNGSNAYVSLPTDSWNNTIGVDFSVSLWVNLTNVSSTQVLIGNLSTISGQFQGWDIRVQSGIPRFNLWRGGAASLISSTTMVANTWYHIVITRKAGGAMNIYVNDSKTTTNSFTNDPVINSTHYPVICALQYDTTKTGFLSNGSKVDSVNIWTRELSASEVTELYNSGNGKQYPN